jgi:hypothetical protein
MSSVASDIDPASEAEPQVVVEESSSAGGGEGEGLCLYMEAGGCKEAFVSWEQCRQAARIDGSDSAERCAEAIVNLRNCMHAHADYYGPVLKVDEAAIAAAATADTDNNKVEESSPSTDEVKKEEADAESESAASAAEAKIEEVEQSASSTATLEAKKEEAVVDKAESSSLGN